MDRANITTNETHRYCVHGTGGLLSIALVWHDYPAALAAAQALVNDLDLIVRAGGLNGFPLLACPALCLRACNVLTHKLVTSIWG